jgi:hypothetical protein
MDFQTYLQLGGIPSRKLMHDSGLEYTGFRSDTNDQENSVWDKVFFNLNDYGTHFHTFMSNSTPTVYGPILLALKPSAIDNAEDLAICFRSAGHSEFNRGQESISSLQEVERLYANPADHKYPYNIKFKSALAKDFPGYQVTGQPELSATMPDCLMSFDHLVACTVDPLRFEGHELDGIVRDLVRNSNWNFEDQVYRRNSKRTDMYNELVQAVAPGRITLEQIINSEKNTKSLMDWARKTNEVGLEMIAFQPFQTYLREGTLEVVRVNQAGERSS